jgi:sulfite reductase (NADPH) flavoprotein alpha-component
MLTERLSGVGVFGHTEPRLIHYNFRNMSESTLTAPPETTTNSTAPVYSKTNPYPATVLVNELLTGPQSEKETIHIEMELADGMTYTPGDALGVVPTYCEESVNAVLKALGFSGDETVIEPVKGTDGNRITVREALTSKLGIGKLARGSVNQYAKLAGDNVPEGLKALLGTENKVAAEAYVWGREFVDLVTDFPGVVKDPQDLFNILQRLMPRMYSIASSQMAHPGQVHLTVRVVMYDAHGRHREGVTSGMLGHRAPVNGKLPVFLDKNDHFRLPEDPNTPIIMIGPGTGIAPFRAFLEEREARGAKGDNWLVFGDQRAASDYLYKEQFERMHASGFLTKLQTAFSRDQATKIYVQDRCRECSDELYSWLERGAHFYVCGDASRMAKDVEQVLLESIAKGTGGSPEQAADYLKKMKADGRYQRDVY